MKLIYKSVASHQAGVTLIELLVALALGLAVLVGLSAVYVAAKQSFRFQETAGRLQEDANFSLESIARDMRMAGFSGCRGVDVATVSGVTTYYPTLALSSSPLAYDGPNPLAAVEPTNAMVVLQPLSPQNFLRGFDNVPSAMFAAAAVPVSSSTDSIFFSSGSPNAVSVSAQMANTSSNLTIAADPYKWGSATANNGVYYMIVSDCISSSLFAGKTSVGGAQIEHGTGVVNTPGNAADTFPGSAIYGVDALVMPIEWNFYYVATRAGANTPSLYRVFYDGNNRQPAQEIVSNVESMKLHYGENIYGKDASNLQCNLPVANCTPTYTADVWRTTAATVTDWSNVVAVRVGLMMVSADNSANPDVVTVTPTLLGQSYTPPVGSSTTRLRKEFSTTVVLRNRVVAR
jgi:type IV pilus assembly protein PilW